MKLPYGAALDVAASPAFLFQCGATDLWAITLDGTGANLPREGCEAAWELRQKFALGIREPIPAPLPPEPVLVGIRADGYYVWRDTNTSKPHSTSQ